MLDVIADQVGLSSCRFVALNKSYKDKEASLREELEAVQAQVQAAQVGEPSFEPGTPIILQ